MQVVHLQSIGEMKMYNNFSKKLPDNDYTRRNMPLIKKAAEEYLDLSVKALPYSKFKLFTETGSRVEYEADYIEHRRRVNVLAAMCLYEDDPKWVYALEDALWAICDEITWALPAHISNTDFEDYYTFLDLFSCETGFVMSEIWYLLNDKLSETVNKRIKQEVRKRIIEPYLKGKHRWGKNNWSAVCAGGIGCAIMYMGTKDEFALVMDNLKESMERFLESFYDDGCCMEGSLYWEYGFGYFCYFSQMLYEYTNGEIDYLKNEKVHNIALFRQKICLSGNMVIPFADAPHCINYNPGLIHFLAKKFDDATITEKEFEMLFGDDTRHRFAPFIRSFFWYDENLKKFDKSCDSYFPDAEWYIKNTGEMTFASKGGNNAEPHNHNDIGSFVVVKGKEFIIDDLGWPEYYNGYFGPDRIKDICASSKGHSVPIINGLEQQPGADSSGEIKKADSSGFKIEFSKTYKSENIKNVTRDISFDEDKIILKDSFSGDITGIRERFVTRIKPAIKDGTVEISGVKIETSAKCEIEITTAEYEPRKISNANMKDIETAYLIDFCFEKLGEVKFWIY